MSKSFRQFLEAADHSSWYSFSVDDMEVHVLRETSPHDAKKLDEATHKGKPLGGKYSAQLHPPHGGQGEKHLHVYAKKNQIFALNVSGTAHDKSHGVTIPNKVAAAIRQHFPILSSLRINVIEHADLDGEIMAIATMLLEG